MRCTDEDQVLIGAELVKDVDDFDIEPLRLGAPKDGEAVALHPGADLVDVNELRGRLSDGRAQKRRAQYETQPGQQPLHALEA